MIDLHTHTTYSDGIDTVKEILKKAENLKLEVISITDHDEIKAYLELKDINISDYYSGKIITGTEITTIHRKIPIEVLAYNIDIDKFKNSLFVTDNKKRLEAQKKCLRHYIEVGNKLGIKCDQGLKLQNDNEYASLIYLKEIKKYKENYEIIPDLLNVKEELFYRLTIGNLDSPFFMDETENNPSLDFVIDEIHRCGGKAFLAHLYVYEVKDHVEFLKSILDGTDIDGVECYYSLYTEKQTNEILAIAKEYNKYISGGSDYHGKNKRGIELGVGTGNLNIPSEIINNWN